MKKLLLTLIAITFIATPAFADHNGKTHGPLHNITVGIEGMVCDFCARALEKIFYQEKGVEGVIVDLDKKNMTLEMAEGANITDERIKERVYYAGYKAGTIRK